MLTAITKGLAAKRDRLEKDDKGFTLIELLVVILIIGILAAIAIPVFLGQQASAKDTAAKSDLANAKIAVIAYATDHDGSYTGATALTLKDYGYTLSDGGAKDFAITTGPAGAFCVSEKSATETSFAASDLKAPAKGTCSATGVFTG